MTPKATHEEIRAGNRKVKVSNLTKVFYPETGFTKGDVIEYYRAVAPSLLAHIKDRPLSLKRYPDGVAGGFFYEKRCPPHRPDWIKTVAIRRKRDNKNIDYCVIHHQAALVWAANLANLEIHVSLAKISDIGRPSNVVFDLDPGPPADIIECARVALWIRDLMTELGLESFVKTSGSKGLQLYVPLNTKVGYDVTGPFAHSVARLLEEREPDAVVSRMKKELRGGKVLIDWSQNDDHKTTVAPYSLRAKERPSVSTPVTWEEIEGALKAGDPEKLFFSPEEILARIEKHGDLFEPVRKLRQRLPDLPS